MRRFLLAACFTVIACDDDAPSSSGAPEDASAPKDAAAPFDARVVDAAIDGAVDRVEDAAPGTADSAAPDATVAVLDAGVDAGFDAGADAGSDAGADAGSDAGTDASMCVDEGERCDQGVCCEGSACVTSSEAAYNICAQTCSEDTECDSGCCHTLPGSGADKVCAPELHCANEEPELQPIQVPCIAPQIVGGDGVYLGKATARFETESVCNKNGDYGSIFGAKSIFNRNGTYGGIGQYSAYSTSALKPPTLKCPNSSFVEAYVGKTQLPQNERVIDPDDLCEVLQRSNL